MKKILSLIFVLLLLAPAALAITAHSVGGDLQSFGRGISAAMPPNSDMAGFIDGMLGSMPLFGLIVIIFGLMFFVTKITIFKSPEHDKYARMIAFGVALMGLAQQSVYNTILGLATSFLTLSFIIAIVFMFIMFVNHSRKAHLTSHAELHKITGNALNARRDLEKIKHELKHEDALYQKTEKDLAQLNSDLNSTSRLVGSELSQVDKIAQMLRKATAAHQSGNSNAVNQYVAALSKDLGGLVTTMQHEQKTETHLTHMVSEIESELAKWGHSADKEKSDEEHLKSLFHKFSQTWGHKIKSDEIDTLYKNEHSLIKQLKNMHVHLRSLQYLYDKIISSTERLEKASYQRKHLEANAVRDNLMNQQFSEAHKHLDNLRAIIEYEPHAIKELQVHSSELQQLLSRIDEEEKNINRLIQNKVIVELDSIRTKIKTKDKQNKTTKRKKTRAYLNVRNKFEGAIHNIIGNLSILIQGIHGERQTVKHYTKKGVPQYGDDPSMMSLLNQLQAIVHQLGEWSDKISHQGADLIEIRKRFLSYWKQKQAYLNNVNTQLPQDKRTSRAAAKSAADRIEDIIEEISSHDFLKDFEKVKPDVYPYDGQRIFDIDHKEV